MTTRLKNWDDTDGWVDAEYKEPTPKENLVNEDCVKFSDVVQMLTDIEEAVEMGEGYEYDRWRDRLEELQCVLPKAKTANWKKEMIKKINDGNCTIYDPKWTCSECGQEYDGGIANSIIKYCFNCGCKMEVENGNDERCT